jgi:hypothetical protein
MKNLTLFLLLVVVAVLFGAHDLIAQPPPPALPQDVTQAPIDGGLALLALSGGAYALKKIRGSKK